MSDLTTAPLTRTVNGRLVPNSGTYRVDSSHTTVDFVARHLMMAKVRGTFAGVTGTLTVGEDPIQSSLEAIIDTSTVNTREEGRDTHLRSADFFDVENHPQMTFRSSSVRPKGDHWVADGELTIRGTTKPLTLDIEFLGAITDPWGGSRVAFSATGELDREEFGLTWNAALETGGVLVGKTVKIEIDAELVLEASPTA